MRSVKLHSSQTIEYVHKTQEWSYTPKYHDSSDAFELLTQKKVYSTHQSTNRLPENEAIPQDPDFISTLHTSTTLDKRTNMPT